MELELKFAVDRDYHDFLLKKGFAEQKFKHQVDTYFIVDEVIAGYRTWLRLREDKLNQTASLDYHKLVSEYATAETEVSISPSELPKMQTILQILGGGVKCTVDKQRRTYCRDDVKITQDEITGLGRFVEIEIEGEETPDNRERINHLARQMNLRVEDHINAGYPELLLKNRS